MSWKKPSKEALRDLDFGVGDLVRHIRCDTDTVFRVRAIREAHSGCLATFVDYVYGPKPTIIGGLYNAGWSDAFRRVKLSPLLHLVVECDGA